MSDNPGSFWKELLGGVGNTLLRLVVTGVVLFVLGAIVGGAVGWFWLGPIGAAIGAIAGAIVFTGGWILMYQIVTD